MYRADLKFGLSNRSHWWESASSNVFFLLKAQQYSISRLSHYRLSSRSKKTCNSCVLSRRQPNRVERKCYADLADDGVWWLFLPIRNHHTCVVFIRCRPRCSLFARARLSSIGWGDFTPDFATTIVSRRLKLLLFYGLASFFHSSFVRASMWYGKEKIRTWTRHRLPFIVSLRSEAFVVGRKGELMGTSQLRKRPKKESIITLTLCHSDVSTLPNRLFRLFLSGVIAPN